MSDKSYDEQSSRYSLMQLCTYVMENLQAAGKTVGFNGLFPFKDIERKVNTGNPVNRYHISNALTFMCPLVQTVLHADMLMGDRNKGTPVCTCVDSLIPLSGIVFIPTSIGAGKTNMRASHIRFEKVISDDIVLDCAHLLSDAVKYMISWRVPELKIKNTGSSWLSYASTELRAITRDYYLPEVLEGVNVADPLRKQYGLPVNIGGTQKERKKHAQKVSKEYCAIRKPVKFVDHKQYKLTSTPPEKKPKQTEMSLPPGIILPEKPVPPKEVPIDLQEPSNITTEWGWLPVEALATNALFMLDNYPKVVEAFSGNMQINSDVDAAINLCFGQFIDNDARVKNKESMRETIKLLEKSRSLPSLRAENRNAFLSLVSADGGVKAVSDLMSLLERAMDIAGSLSTTNNKE